MSITDELREWAKGSTLSSWTAEHLLAIADRIDAEHEESIQREHESAYDAGYAEGMGVANKADMRAEYLRGKNDGYDEGWDAAAKTMTEYMVELPKDADDVPWNVGDRDEDGNVVTQLRLTSAGWFIITDGNWPYRPKHKRHRHAPTVEDVLREFADEVYADADNEIRDRDFLCAKYAKRLMLAEGEDA